MSRLNNIQTNANHLRGKFLTVDKSEFSGWLQEELNKRGWKAADLARAAGFSDATISNVINEIRNAGPDLCRGIAKALGEPEEKVFRLAGLLSPLTGPQEQVSFGELYDLWKHLNPGDRQVLREWATFRYKTARDSSPDD